MRKLVIGAGYVGLRVAKAWLAHGCQVFAVTRKNETARRFRSLGLQPVVADVTEPATLKDLPDCESVLFSVGFDRTSGRSIEDVYVMGLRSVLAALRPGLRRLIYTSSTGVYGQSNDEWVDEDSPCHPIRAGGRACLAAEREIEKHPIGKKAVVLRLAGIYGPDRIPRRKDLLSGQPLRAAIDGYLNLIHVDDAVQAILAADHLESTPKTYVLSDGNPVLRRSYYEELGRLLDLPDLHFANPAEGSPAAERARASKRVRSAKAIRELGLSLNYPTYREGLDSIIEAERS